MKVVITGTSRGIGLALARQVLAAGHELLAVARQPGKSGALTELASRHAGRVSLLATDLGDPGAAAAIAAAAADWDAVDVLVNNAGILLQSTRREDFLTSFAINSVAPFEVTQALLPRLRKSSHPRVAHITSRMGSVADNLSGGYYADRSSKAALNAINMSLRRDHDWLTSAVIHPGWVKTDMGGVEAPVPAEVAAAGIWRVIAGLEPWQSGAFLDYEGRQLPW
jgi:NAD(P)-dependent dehydrogenase (short-subunit alcohol dehydrogenase family)